MNGLFLLVEGIHAFKWEAAENPGMLWTGLGMAVVSLVVLVLLGVSTLKANERAYEVGNPQAVPVFGFAVLVFLVFFGLLLTCAGM